ncbi:TonB-dependent siderophore receptor [Pseudomonas solani]|uniref:TonB-dependent siderophore receptor n=1 Tax=Pseudomonas solani TaxID=2731552 RepID=UPI003D6B40EC
MNHSFPTSLRPSVRAVRHGLLAMLLASGAPLVALPAVALAASEAQQGFNVPAGSLSGALAAFAEQAGVSVAMPPALAAGKQSPGLSGNWSVLEGLQRLMRGTGLEAVPGGEGVYLVRPLPEAGAGVELGATSIIGNRQDVSGPLRGYVAERSAAGTKTDTPLIRTAQSVSVVTRDQMDDQGVTSVAQALRYAGGTFAEYRGSSHRVDEVFSRGFGYTPTYLDGLSFGGESRSQVDPWMLERVELIHGPASVLYGQASPGGLLAMTSKRPSQDARNALQLGVGTDSLRRGAFDLNGQLDEAGTLLYRLNGVLSKGQAEVDHVDEERHALAPALTWQPDEDTRLTLLGYYQHDPEAGYRNFWPTEGVANSGRFGRLSRHFDVGDPDFYKSEREQSSLGYQFEHRFNDLLTFRQNLRYLQEDADYRQMVFMTMTADGRYLRRAPSASREELKQWMVDNQLQFDFQTGPLAHTLLAGVDYKRTRLDTDTARDLNWFNNYLLDSQNPVYHVPVGTLTTIDDNSQRAEQLGAYLQDQIEWGGWNLMIGGRKDRSEVETDNHLADTRVTVKDDKFTGRVGLLYAFENGISPYASYSTSFEPELSSGAPGSSPFKPTTGKQTEVGVKYQPVGTEALFTLAWFDLTQRNVVAWDSNLGYNVQNGEVHSRGLEFEARGNLGENLELVGSFTYLKPEVTESAQAGVEDMQPARQPNHLASLWGTYQLATLGVPGLSVGAGARYVGSSYGDARNTYKVASVTLFDAMLGYELKFLAPELEGASVQLNASNLTDKVYAASCAGSDSCFYGASRTLTANLNYAW